MFETYLGGSSLVEVSRHFNEYSQGAVFFTAYHHNWPSIRDEVVNDLQHRIKQKVLYSKYQQLDLVSTMINVAHVEAMQAMQTYLKHPNDKNLPKSLRIKSIKDLATAIEMMAQIIGQDNNKRIDVTGNITTTPLEGEKPAGATTVEGALTEATAKALLKTMNKKDRPEPDVVEAEVVK